MKKSALLLVAAALWLCAESSASAQIAYVTYYQPAVYQSVGYQSVGYQSVGYQSVGYQSVGYQPVGYQPTTVYSPVVPNCATPQVAYYAPAAVYAPAAPAVAYQPVASVRTRYRPFLGGTVTRVRYGYAPTYVAPVPALVAY